MKILVAIPIYDGRVPAQVMNALFNEQAEAFRNGDEIFLHINYGSAGIAFARNMMATAFLDSDCDRLFFLDSDITWETGDLLKIAKMPVDFVGGCYPLKRLGEKYPVAWLPHDPKGFKGIPLSENTALIEVEGLPTGFLALSRRVFEKFLKAYPDRGLTEQLGHKCYCFFEMPFIDGHLYGEDLYFCRKWIEMGEKIYLYPEATLVHWDFRATPHMGHIGNWLRGRENPQPQPNEFQDHLTKLTENMGDLAKKIEHIVKGNPNGKNDAIPTPAIS